MTAVTERAVTLTAPREPILEALNVTKRFGDFTALEDVSLTLLPGSFHALLGENGAGKSTLVKCIMGYQPADSGKIVVRGEEVRFRSPKEATAHGIGMVYQHFTLVDNMTVTENLVLARPKHPFLFDWATETARVREFMQGMPFRLDPGTPVRTLSAGEKQKLEILKQLYLGSSIVILDEPTSVLTPSEADEVLGLLRTMAAEGRVSVLMISHKFREVMAFADEVTILRRGRLCGRGRVADLTPARMAEMMVGSEPPRVAAEKATRPPGKVVLALKDISALDDLGTPAVTGLCLEVRQGEIVGIAGVSGNGQEELVEVLAGQRQVTGGEIHVDDSAYRATRQHMHRKGVRCLPDEPLRNACVANMSVAENMAFRHFDRHPVAVGKTLVNRGALRRSARTLIGEYGIRTPSADSPIGSLSGGNVQRAVLARELSSEVALLVASNPCFGLDFAAVAEIRSRIVRARNGGSAVLLVSADLDELFALADRILVMSDGRVVHETTTEKAEISVIGKHMAGHA